MGGVAGGAGMSGMQRSKGKAGEREIASLLREVSGWDVQRRIRQHTNDDDLVGVPGWSLEVKRHRAATASVIAAWWAQAVAQAGGSLPVLLYRLDRQEWRAVWPVSVLMTEQRADYWRGYEWTAETSVAAWVSVVRETKPLEMYALNV